MTLDLRGRARRSIGLGAVAAVMATLFATGALANDFPTAARVDYVLGCMAANGQDQLVMARCSCSIDYIADRMAYAEYTEIETIKRMRLVPGERAGIFRDVPRIRDALDHFQLLQVEADLQCF